MSTCLQRNELERYLNGWMGEPESQQIESHLANCSACEETVILLESETTTAIPGVVTRQGNQENGQGSQETGSSSSLVPLSVTESTDREPRVEPPASDNHSESDPPIQHSEPISNQDQTSNNDPLQQALAEIRGWNGTEIRLSRHLFSELTPGDFGSYELHELIGRGGMAEVYRGRHKRLQREVAIKLLRVPATCMHQSLERIEREIQAVGRLQHPAIVSAFDAGEHDGCQFLVTEFIDGLDVGKIARANRTMPFADACEIVRQAALGLDHAHAHGIIHRDIKPSNVMVDRNGKVKVLDFGLVRLDESSQLPAEVTTVGQLLGTLDYMAPEQAERADHASHRSDIYSLGATLFRLLAGRAPYAATANQSPLEKLRLLAIDQPPKLRTLRPDLPEGLCNLVDGSLARDPAERPASAAHLAEQLEPFCNGHDLAVLVSESLASQQETSDLDHEGKYVSAIPDSKNDLKRKSLKGQRSNARNRIWKWLVGLGMSSAAVVAGIILILETQKGRIVIESDEPNLKVSLVSDGKVRETVELVPGENTTRVYAGEYEIQIEGASDRYEIENQRFVLKRGETVVARVRVESGGESSTERLVGTSGDRNAHDRGDWLTQPQEPRVLRLYQVTSDVEFAERILHNFSRIDKDVTIESDLENQRIAVFATEQQHEEIGQAMSQLQQTGDATSPISSVALGLIYDGFPLEHWLKVISTEVNVSRLKEAKEAISELAQKSEPVRDFLRIQFSESLLPPQEKAWQKQFYRDVGLEDPHTQALLNHLNQASDNEVAVIVEMLIGDFEYRFGAFADVDRWFINVEPMLEELKGHSWSPHDRSVLTQTSRNIWRVVEKGMSAWNRFTDREQKGKLKSRLDEFSNRLFSIDAVARALTEQYLRDILDRQADGESYWPYVDVFLAKMLEFIDTLPLNDSRVSRSARLLTTTLVHLRSRSSELEFQNHISRVMLTLDKKLKSIAESSPFPSGTSIDNPHGSRTPENRKIVQDVNVVLQYPTQEISRQASYKYPLSIDLPLYDVMLAFYQVSKFEKNRTPTRPESFELIRERLEATVSAMNRQVEEHLGEDAKLIHYRIQVDSFVSDDRIKCRATDIQYEKASSKLSETEKQQLTRARAGRGLGGMGTTGRGGGDMGIGGIGGLGRGGDMGIGRDIAPPKPVDGIETSGGLGGEPEQTGIADSQDDVVRLTYQTPIEINPDSVTLSAWLIHRFASYYF